MLRNLCDYTHGTEYFMVQHYNQRNLYYCLKRPQWSLFTSSNAKIVYSLCKRCTNLNSNIMFLYQIIDAYSMQTLTDEFVKIIFGHAHTALMCIHVNCTIKQYTIHIRVHKFQKLVVITKESSVLPWDESNSSQDGRIKTIMVDYFYTSVKIRLKDFWISRYHHVLYKAQNGTIETLSKPSSTISFESPINCSETTKCHHVLELTNKNGAYNHITIKEMVFLGLQVPSCFYGGIGFYEQDSQTGRFYEKGSEIGSINKQDYQTRSIYKHNSQRGHFYKHESQIRHFYEKKYPRFYGQDSSENKESLTLCDSYSHFEKKQFQVTEQRQNWELSQFYFKEGIKPIAPYVSSTNVVLVIFYFEPHANLNVTLTWTSINCKGIFINPCAKVSKLFLSTIPAMEKNFTYGSSNKNNSCSLYQIGPNYVSNSMNYSDDLFMLNAIRILGCTTEYEVQPHNKVACIGLVDFVHIMQRLKYYPRRHGQVVFGDHFTFYHNTGNLDQFNCKAHGTERPSPKKIEFGTPKIDIIQNSYKIHRFKTKVFLKEGLLVNSLPGSRFSPSERYTLSGDIFTTVVWPFVSIVKLRQQLCKDFEQANSQQSSAPVSPLGQHKTICLRDSMQNKARHQGFLKNPSDWCICNV